MAKSNGSRTGSGAGDVPEHVLQNIDAIATHHAHIEEALTGSQRWLERFSVFVARPAYLIGVVAFVVSWAVYNLAAPRLGLPQFDPPPFGWLQGIMAFTALLTSTAVLIRQTRQAKLAEQRAHLDLQVNLLAEQKASKIITLVEELRRDLPMVRNPYDSEAEALKESTAPDVLLAEVEKRLAEGGSTNGEKG